MSSAEGGLEVGNPEPLDWLKYLGGCPASAAVDGEGMEIAGDWLKMPVSYWGGISADALGSDSVRFRWAAELSAAIFSC
jgi:hypothetical protein